MLYESIDRMWIDLLNNLLDCGEPERGSRDGDVCGEIIGWSGKLMTDPQKTLLMNPTRDMSPSYAAAEVLWYMGGSGAIKMLEAYAPSYRKFASGNVTYGAYGPRLFWRNDLTTPLIENAVSLLQDDQLSRQAVVSIWHPGDLWEAYMKRKDIPCTLTMQFLLRDNKLHMIVNMRSNDAWLGFPLDVFAFTCIQRLVANELQTGLGYYHHHVGSMHLYSKYRDMAKVAVQYKCHLPSRTLGHSWFLPDTISSMQKAVELERRVREDNTLIPPHFSWLGDMGQDLLRACALKSRPSRVQELGQFTSPAFRALAERKRDEVSGV